MKPASYSTWPTRLKPLVNLVRAQPVMAVFEATLICNQSCGYCDLPLNQGRPEMSREDIKRVFSDLYAEGVRYVLVQGGEPTARKDCLQILEDLHSIGFSLSLVTNGTRLTEDFVAGLKRLRVAVAVSLDTLDRERYRLIRGNDHLRKVLQGIDNLAAYPHAKSLVCIVNEINRPDVESVVRFARQKNFMPVVGAYHWGVDKYGKANKGLQFQREAAIEVFQSLLTGGQLPKGLHTTYVEDNIRWLGDARLGRCDAGRYSIVVGAQGHMSACLAHDPVGNLLETPLRELLAKFDQAKIKACSDASSCNLWCARTVGNSLQHPVAALQTWRARPVAA
jgi:MoaA/NifB/PqqE/SkfB family radical SAM enzyme